MSEIFKMRFGSHVYGTNLPSSDSDFKGVYIPTAKDIVLGTTKESITTSTRDALRLKNDASDIDLEIFSLKKYMKLLLEGQTVALTMLFCPKEHCLLSTPTSKAILKYKDKWLHKGVSAFAGYCRQQANKYGIKGSRVASTRAATNYFARMIDNYGNHAKLKEHWDDIVKYFSPLEHVEFITDVMRGCDDFPVRMLSVCNRKVQEHITVKEAHRIYKHLFDEYGQRALQAEKNENVDWKAMYHAVRVACEAQELLTYHTITYPRPEKDILLRIRKGELPYQQVAELIEQGLLDMEQASLNSTLPDKPDYQFAEDFIYTIYLEEVRKGVDLIINL